MGVFIVTLLTTSILGAVSFKIDYVPLNPNYLPYFDPTFNPHDHLSQSASANYLIPVIKPVDTVQILQPKIDTSATDRSYLPLQQNTRQSIGNEDYLVPPLAEEARAGYLAPQEIANRQKEIVDANGVVVEEFGKRIAEVNLRNGVEQVNNGYSGYQNLDVNNEEPRKKVGFTIVENYDYKPGAQSKSSDSEEAYYREIEKQAELETEKKFRESRKEKLVVKKPAAYSSYVMSVVDQNVPVKNNIASAYQIQHTSPDDSTQAYYAPPVVNQVTLYKNPLITKPRTGRKLESSPYQDISNKKISDTSAATNDWEPIAAPYDAHQHKEEEDHGGEVHYHQHKHIHKHSHHQDHQHQHDQEHKHIHNSGHDHGHSHTESHGHSHDDSHTHSHDHHQSHSHDHHEDHDHGHNHKHQHLEAHKHNHQQAHKHGHGHKHDHGHDHSHSQDHKHDHHHGHKHSHHADHGHDHKHGHKHAHDHGHKHSHDQHHEHAHEHGHKHGHKHDHKHGHKHSKH